MLLKSFLKGFPLPNLLRRFALAFLTPYTRSPTPVAYMGLFTIEGEGEGAGWGEGTGEGEGAGEGWGDPTGGPTAP